LAVFRFGGLAASFGGVTWRAHKAVGSSAKPEADLEEGTAALVAGTVQ